MPYCYTFFAFCEVAKMNMNAKGAVESIREGETLPRIQWCFFHGNCMGDYMNCWIFKAKLFNAFVFGDKSTTTTTILDLVI
jgi:hypothetical protein